MILLPTSRHYVETALAHFFPYINEYKKTAILNVAHHSRISDEYLGAVILSCTISEVELLFKKEALKYHKEKCTFKFSDAQGIVFYKILIALPLPSEQIYFNQVRNRWIQLLDAQVVKHHLITTSKKGD